MSLLTFSRWRQRTPRFFLTRSERRLFAERVKHFESKSDCELIFHLRRKLDGPDIVETNKRLFYRFKLDKTLKRTAILVTLALAEKKLAIWADEGVVRRSDDKLFDRTCLVIAAGLGRGERLKALLGGIDELEKTLAIEQPAQTGKTSEISDEPIIE